MFKKQQLLMYRLQGSSYQLNAKSLYFPGFDLPETIARCLETAYQRNSSAAIRELRQRLSEV